TGPSSCAVLARGSGSLAGMAIGAANPYFVRFSSSETATVLGDAVAQGPTFFSLWAGANDILLYATGGGTGMDQSGNLDPSTYARNDITDPNVFRSEEHTSELQSRENLVCRLLLEKKNNY